MTDPSAEGRFGTYSLFGFNGPFSVGKTTLLLRLWTEFRASTYNRMPPSTHEIRKSVVIELIMKEIQEANTWEKPPGAVPFFPSNLAQWSANFPYKRLQSKYFRLCSICCKYSAMGCESSHCRCGNKWVWLVFNKPLFARQPPKKSNYNYWRSISRCEIHVEFTMHVESR